MPCTDPIISMLEPFRSLIYRSHLEENADPLAGNAARARPPYGDGSAMADRP